MTKINRTVIPFSSFLCGILVIGHVDLVFILLSLIAIGSIYAGAGVINDLFDSDIDAKASPNRPLPSGNTNRKQIIMLFFAFSIIGLSVAYVASELYNSQLFLWLMLIEFVLGVLYSATLSKHFITANGVLGMSHGVIPFLAATLTANIQPNAEILIISILLWTVLFFTYNLKDMKDYEGDALKRTTLPTLFGPDKARGMNAMFLGLPLVVNMFLFLSSDIKPLGFGLGILPAILLFVIGYKLRAFYKQEHYVWALNTYRILMALFLISLAFVRVF